MRALVLAVALVVTGCHAASVHPLVTPEQRVAEPKAIGTWVQEAENDPIILEISAGADKLHRVVFRNSQERYLFDAAVGKLGKNLYADVQLSEDDPGLKAVAEYVLRPHFLLGVGLEGDALVLRVVDKHWLRKKLESGALKLDWTILHAGSDDEKILFGSPTPVLQEAIRRLEGERQAFRERVVFRRKKDVPAGR